MEKISKILNDHFFKEREFALEVLEPNENKRLDTACPKLNFDEKGIKLKVNLFK